MKPGLAGPEASVWRGLLNIDLPRDVNGRSEMLWTIAVILLVLWVLGLVSSYTLGGFIHVLLVVALVVFLIGIIQGRRV